jgi:TonB family protein
MKYQSALLFMSSLVLPLWPLLLATEAHSEPMQQKVIKQIKQLKQVATPKPAKPAVPSIRDKWAVLIGVGRYNDSAIGNVKYATSNVLKLAKVLVDPNVGRFAPDHVLVVTQDKANKANLAQAVYEDWLIKKALPNDLIVIYICMKAIPNDAQNDLLLFGADGSASEKEKTASSLAGMLGEVRRRTQSKNIVCLLDTTMSNTLIHSPADKYPRGFSEILKKIGVDTQTTILAADLNLLQSKEAKLTNSTSFIEYFTEGLKAGAGMLPIETVAGFITESMEKEGGAEPGPGKSAGLGQKPGLLSNPENRELTKVAFGIPIKNTAFSAANVHVGHSIEQLEETNPELAIAAHRMQDMPDPTNPQRKIDQLLQSEQKAAAAGSQEGKVAAIPAPAQDDEDDDNDGSNVDFAPYMAAMKKSIQAKWVSPKGFDQKKVVAVFSIQRDGRITEAELIESSGSAEIDKSAMQALKDASPLAPLPKGAPKHVQIRYQFDYKVN